jgi:hypothetical protein
VQLRLGLDSGYLYVISSKDCRTVKYRDVDHVNFIYSARPIRLFHCAATVAIYAKQQTGWSSANRAQTAGFTIIIQVILARRLQCSANRMTDD